MPNIIPESAVADNNKIRFTLFCYATKARGSNIFQYSPWIWKGKINKGGYGICGDGFPYSLAHRSSYKLFVGNIPKGMCVCHKNDIKLDITPSNLFLGTKADNCRDRTKKDRQAKGKEVGTSKLEEKEVIEIRKLYNNGNNSQRKLAKIFNVTQCNIGYIIRGESWKYLIKN